MNTESTVGQDDGTEVIACRECLTFKLANEWYGLDILDIEEICVWQQPTPMPYSPDFIKGVINLRGMIIPIMDLRCRFLMPEANYHPSTVVIIIKPNINSGASKLMGIIVDSVCEVANFSEEQIQDYQPMAENGVQHFVKQIATHNRNVISLIESAKLMEIERCNSLQEAS